MSLAKKSLSILGKLTILAVLFAAFTAGLGAVVFMALRSPEVQVPEVVGKNFGDGEKDLASLDLKIRKRTDRFSQEAPNTILEQTPLPGEKVKAGQTISVVLSRAEQEGDEKPAEVKKEKAADKPKGVDEPSEVDKARQKRRAANKNSNAAGNNANSNSAANAKSNAAVNADSGNGDSATGNANSNSRPANSGSRTNSNQSGTNANSRSTIAPAAANRSTTAAPARPAGTGANNNRRPQ